MVSLRPKQWTKNLLVFLALLFSINESWRPTAGDVALTFVGQSVLAFLLFCALSSGIYLVNDLLDLEQDKEHPQKRHRPLASGELPIIYGGLGAALLLSLSLALGLWWKGAFGLVLLAYAAAMVAYSLLLKHMVIIDVFTLAFGFLLRALGGAVAIGVPVSPWLYVCAILGALFLGFGKRRHELVLLEGNASQHRGILAEYSPRLLDEMMGVVTPATVIAYSLYTFTAPNLPTNNAMMATIPFVLYGIFRYLYLVHSKNQGGSPEDILLSDLPIMIDVFLWIVVALGILWLFRG